MRLLRISGLLERGCSKNCLLSGDSTESLPEFCNGLYCSQLYEFVSISWLSCSRKRSIIFCTISDGATYGDPLKNIKSKKQIIKYILLYIQYYGQSQ